MGLLVSLYTENVVLYLVLIRFQGRRYGRWTLLLADLFLRS